MMCDGLINRSYDLEISINLKMGTRFYKELEIF